MAKLRDARTSALIAEGTPLEVVLVARALGRKAIVLGAGDELGDDVDLLFDDVGLAFDPAAVLAAHADELDALPTAIKAAAAGADRDAVARRRVELERIAHHAATELAPGADAALEAARALVE